MYSSTAHVSEPDTHSALSSRLSTSIITTVRLDMYDCLRIWIPSNINWCSETVWSVMVTSKTPSEYCCTSFSLLQWRYSLVYGRSDNSRSYQFRIMLPIHNSTATERVGLLFTVFRKYILTAIVLPLHHVFNSLLILCSTLFLLCSERFPFTAAPSISLLF